MFNNLLSAVPPNHSFILYCVVFFGLQLDHLCTQKPQGFDALALATAGCRSVRFSGRMRTEATSSPVLHTSYKKKVHVLNLGEPVKNPSARRAISCFVVLLI